jgi:hypothetical protein
MIPWREIEVGTYDGEIYIMEQLRGLFYLFYLCAWFVLFLSFPLPLSLSPIEKGENGERGKEMLRGPETVVE